MTQKLLQLYSRLTSYGSTRSSDTILRQWEQSITALILINALLFAALALSAQLLKTAVPKERELIGRRRARAERRFQSALCANRQRCTPCSEQITLGELRRFLTPVFWLCRMLDR